LQGYAYDKPATFEENMTLGEYLLTPTRIYVRSILEALKENDANGNTSIKGMAHITGGGFVENVPRVLADNLGAEIDANGWDLPPLFKWLAELGKLSHDDLAATLNCGIGMAVVCAPEEAEKLAAIFEAQGETVYTIGHVTAHNGDEHSRVTIKNQDTAWA
ncbi:MAG: AIR synthase-related protein, partial [Cohaesibacter sp.]|nr:AIR synthase-related protein [Cohaesibacter sp.]